ncbi:MAG: amino acid/amide transporter ATP-binding protein 2, family [Frankiales bacterium]|nr:amino acid/amide transporter ATP-binding protein 2, family [Frankiales bacterium]
MTTAINADGQRKPPLLEIDDVVAGYGAGVILKGVKLVLHRGDVMCLIGPNGAGKSTVLKTVSGLLRPKDGAVRLEGEDVTTEAPKAKLRRGVVHVPQERSLFPGMTVWDNLLMGGYLMRNNKILHARIDEAAQMFPIITSRRSAHAGSLSGGEQKQVELARTLLFDPKLILLDEPSIGLDPKSRRLVFDAIRSLAAAGRTILLVEQNARSGLAASDQGAVLESGLVRLTGPAAHLLGDPEVARLYLGASQHARPSNNAPALSSALAAVAAPTPQEELT